MITHYRVENNRYSRGEDSFTHVETLSNTNIMLSRRFIELPGKDKGPVSRVHELITRLKGRSRRGLERYRTILERYGRFKKHNGWIERQIGTFSTGIGTFSTGTGTFSTGIRTFYTGIRTFSTGIGTFYTGIRTFSTVNGRNHLLIGPRSSLLTAKG